MIDLSQSGHYTGDCRDLLRQLPDGSVQTCITSPPYYALRDYGVVGQIGLEATPELYIESMVSVFDEVRRVLADDGTLWLNLGDSYASGGRGGIGDKSGLSGGRHNQNESRRAVESHPSGRSIPAGYKKKDMLGMPWRVAFALQASGWYLRCDIIWCLSGGAWIWARTKKGDMPIMVKDLVRLNPETVKLWNGERWTQVLGWGPSTDESEAIQLHLRSGERIGCTGGHQWPTSRGLVAARDLKVGDTLLTTTLPEPDDAHCPAYLTDDLLWLIGLWMAEGSRSGSTAQLSLNADEQGWLPRIRSAVEHVGGSMSHTIDGNNLAVRMWGAVLNAVFDTYKGGHDSHTHHLTNAVWKLPTRCLRSIAQGYLDGDGHHDIANERWRLGFARNYDLERDLRSLAARLGAILTLHPTTVTYQGGEKPSFRGEWRWSRSGHHNEKDRAEIVDLSGSRARGFWDIAVSDSPNLFALASGVLTHNCKPNPMPESVRDRPTKSHEYIFLLSKGERYYYDADAIRERVTLDPTRQLSHNPSYGH
jgi:DNA methylase